MLFTACVTVDGVVLVAGGAVAHLCGEVCEVGSMILGET